MPIAIEIGAITDDQHKEHEIAIEQKAEGGVLEAQDESRRNKRDQPKAKVIDTKCSREEQMITADYIIHNIQAIIYMVYTAQSTRKHFSYSYA